MEKDEDPPRILHRRRKGIKGEEHKRGGRRDVITSLNKDCEQKKVLIYIKEKVLKHVLN